MVDTDTIYIVEWDLALQQIVPFIDGVKYVKRISMEADVEIAIVKKCLRQLLYYGCITMIDIFLHSNIYATTAQITRLAKDTALQSECAHYITKSGVAGPILGTPPPTSTQILALYCSVQPKWRMSDFCAEFAAVLAHIDVRRFITFGLIHGFLRRVHRYPIHVDRSGGTTILQIQRSPNLSFGMISSPPPMLALSGSTKQTSGIEQDILRMMDGEHHTDAICTNALVRYTDIETMVSKHQNCFVVHQ